MALTATRTTIGNIELSCAAGGITCYGEGRMLAHIEDFLRYDPSYIMRTWRSLDNGATWTELPYVHSHWNIWFFRAISPAPNVILVGVEGPDHCDELDGGFTVGEHDIAALSTDGGDTWGRAGDITALGYTVSGGDPDGQCYDFWDTMDFMLLDDHEVWALGVYVRDGAGLPDEYILRSTDDGLHFTAYVTRPTVSGGTPGQVESGVYLGADTAVLTTSMFNGPARVFRTTNRGTSWTEILLPLNGTHFTNGNSSVDTIVHMGGGVLLVGGTDRQTAGSPLHLWRSIDAGVTWTIVSASGGLPQPAGKGSIKDIKQIAPNVAVAFLHWGVNTLPADFGGNLIWATTDNGVTWTAVPNDGYINNYSFSGAGVGDDGSVSIIYARDNLGLPFYVYRVVPTDIEGATGPCVGFVLPEPEPPEPPGPGSGPAPLTHVPVVTNVASRVDPRVVGVWRP